MRPRSRSASLAASRRHHVWTVPAGSVSRATMPGKPLGTAPPPGAPGGALEELEALVGLEALVALVAAGTTTVDDGLDEPEPPDEHAPSTNVTAAATVRTSRRRIRAR